MTSLQELHAAVGFTPGDENCVPISTVAPFHMSEPGDTPTAQVTQPVPSRTQCPVLLDFLLGGPSRTHVTGGSGETGISQSFREMVRD